MRLFFTLLVVIGLSVDSINAQVPKVIPAFSNMLNLNDSTPFSSDSLSLSHKQFFILFDPGCGHCQKLASGLADSIARIDQMVDIYFFSMQDKAHVDGFINMFAKSLKNHPQVKFIYDPQAEFYLKFSPKDFPSTYIYAEKSSELLIHFDGESEISKLLPFVVDKK